MWTKLPPLKRLWQHWRSDSTGTHAVLDEAALARIQDFVAQSEKRHTGEIRVCVEAALPWSYLRRNAPARERALMLFGKLRVWDTQANNGVLIYLLLAEHRIEIVADRGLNHHVNELQWQTITKPMVGAFQARRFEKGLTQAVKGVGAILELHFPMQSGAQDRNELPDAPVVL